MRGNAGIALGGLARDPIEALEPALDIHDSKTVISLFPSQKRLALKLECIILSLLGHL